MTTISLPNARAESLLRALGEVGFRAPDAVSHPTDMFTAELTWTPDLTAGQQTTLQAIARLAVGAALITPVEREALEPDIDGLRTYHGLATPTNAQSVAAIKAIIRVLRAIFRD